MVLVKEVDLPQFTELNVPEINLSTATLMSASSYLGKQCEGINNEYMLCRQETNDPRPCLELGKKVTSCAIDVFKKIKNECLHEFNQYANCIDKSSGDFSLQYCRKTQGVFDSCMKDKFGMSRPEFGYFCRGRVHTSSRSPLPSPPCPCQPKVPDATPSLPDCKPRPEPRFGNRSYYMNE